MEKYFLGRFLEKLPGLLRHILYSLLLDDRLGLFSSALALKCIRVPESNVQAGAHGFIDREGLYLFFYECNSVGSPDTWLYPFGAPDVRKTA